MDDLYERHRIPHWANVVEVRVEDGMLTVDFDSVDEDIADSEDLE